jgi:peptidyl-prolyl cis-trans isomerase SurA
MSCRFYFRCYAGAQRLALAVAVVVAASWPCCAGVIDSIVASVNRHAILASEWDEAVGFECLMNGRSLNDVTSEDRKQTLQRLIDQELIAQQMRASTFVLATTQEIAARIRELRETVPAWKTDNGWRAALAGYGLTEEDVEERTALQMNLLRYLDLRFRPQIHIDPRAIENYYREELLPPLRRAGASDPPLQQVTSKIEELLVEQRLNQLQDQWVRALRLQADVRWR